MLPRISSLQCLYFQHLSATFDIDRQTILPNPSVPTQHKNEERDMVDELNQIEPFEENLTRLLRHEKLHQIHTHNVTYPFLLLNFIF